MKNYSLAPKTRVNPLEIKILRDDILKGSF